MAARWPSRWDQAPSPALRRRSDEGVHQRQAFRRAAADLERRPRDGLIHRDHFGEQRPVIRQGLSDSEFVGTQVPHPACELGDGHAGNQDLRSIVGEDRLDLVPAGFLAMVREQRRGIEQIDQPSASRSAANSATLSRCGENRRPAPKEPLNK